MRLGNAYLEIVKSADLDEAFTLVDTRITYDLEVDFNNFKDAGIDLATLEKTLDNSNSAILTMFTTPKQVDTDKYDNLWNQHPNFIYRLAGLVVAYVIRLT